MTHEEFLTTFPPLISAYKPQSALLEPLGKVSILMIVGPSGVGKTTLIQRSKVTFVPSDTTREPRAREQNGVDFYFRRDYGQVIEDIKNGLFVQVAIGSGGDFYATKASSFPKSGWATLPVVSAVVPIFRGLGFKKTTTAFIAPPSFEEWIHRMSVHPATAEQRIKRLDEGRRSFEFALADKETHLVLNDDLDLAVAQLKDLLSGKTDPEREKTAQRAIQEILSRLD